MNLAHLLLRSARTAGDRPALFLGEQPLHTYADLAHRATTLGRALCDQQGLRAGDRVGLCLSNHPAVLEILFGCWWAGLAVVPINAKLHPREVQFILGHSGASCVFVSADEAEGLRQQLTESAAQVTAPMPMRPETHLDLIDVDGPAYTALLAGWDGGHR